MKITNEVLDSYLDCKTKGHLKLAGEHGKPVDSEEMTKAASQGVGPTGNYGNRRESLAQIRNLPEEWRLLKQPFAEKPFLAGAPISLGAAVLCPIVCSNKRCRREPQCDYQE